MRLNDRVISYLYVNRKKKVRKKRDYRRIIMFYNTIFIKLLNMQNNLFKNY